MKFIKVVLLLLALTIVLPVTLLVWIPLLIRMIGLIAFAAITSAFTGKNLDGVREGLEIAIRLPIIIVRQTVSAVFMVNQPDSSPQDEDGNGWDRFLKECIFASFFWLSTFVFWSIFSGWSSNLSTTSLFSSSPRYIYSLTFDKVASLEIDVIKSHFLAKDEKSKLRITPYLLTYNVKSHYSELKLTICQISEIPLELYEFYAWYTDRGERNSFRWAFESKEPLKFRPGECKPIPLAPNDDNLFSLEQLDQTPLGILHFSMNDSYSSGSLDLQNLEEQGHIQRKKIIAKN